MTLNPKNSYWSHGTVMGSMMEIFMSWLPQCIWRWCNDQQRCQWWQLNVPLPSQPPSYILRHRMTKGSPRVTWRKTVAMGTRSGASLFLFTPPSMPSPQLPSSSFFVAPVNSSATLPLTTVFCPKFCCWWIPTEPMFYPCVTWSLCSNNCWMK